MPGGPLSLTLRDSLEPPPTTTSPVSSQENHHSLPVETSSPGGGERVLHRLSTGKQEKISITCHLGQAELCLLGEVIEKDLGEVVPRVRLTRLDSAQLVLQGYANEVRTARQLVTDKMSLVLERVVPEVSLNLLSFLREEYGRPGALGNLLGLEGQVESSVCSPSPLGKLDQAEKDLLGEFGEEKIDLPNSAAIPAELRSKLEKKVKEMNQSRCRVVARYGPGCRVQLLGHLKQVQELREEIGAFLIDRSSVRVVKHHQQNQDGVVSEAGNRIKSLRLGLQVVVRQGDITKERADALVNSANEDLDHAGGVAAALSWAGGPEVQWASRDLMLLHAVGPVGGSVGGNERPLLEKTVKTALDLAETMELQTLAMPCISSGIFGVPLKVCSEAIVSAVRDFGREQHILTKVTLIDVSGEAVKAMQEACDRLLQGKREFSGWEGDSSTTTTTTHAPQRDTTSASTRGAAAPEVCVQLEIIQGTIEKQQVDALVSPMVGSDPLSSRVGNVLSKAAGPGLMKAFLRESRGQTAPGDNVLVEGMSGLSSGCVFFLSCALWDNNPQGPAVQALRQGVRKILTSCEKRGLRSIAFPVVGTGVVLQFPHNLAAQVLLEEIRRLFRLPRMLCISEGSYWVLDQSKIAASMTGPAVVAEVAGPALAAETGATMGVGSGIGIGAGIGIAVGVVAGTAATAGAVRGGIVGATAAEEAETVQEAAEKAASAVYNEAKGLYEKAENLLIGYSKSK
ncbi:unnamed protein product [Coregonus sp. 'balchen']|nr:unnamed protein product [Coregonus sp. 'balchen']